jgi:hypothetical protein
MEGRFGSIGDKTKPGQFPKSLPRQGTAEWWTWSGKLKQIAAGPEIGLIADIRNKWRFFY